MDRGGAAARRAGATRALGQQGGCLIEHSVVPARTRMSLIIRRAN